MVSPDGVAPSQMVDVSASVNLPLHHIKSRSSLLAAAHPGGPGKRAIKQLWCGGDYLHIMETLCALAYTGCDSQPSLQPTTT